MYNSGVKEKNDTETRMRIVTMKLSNMVEASANLGRDIKGGEVWMTCDICGCYGVEDDFEDGGLCADCAGTCFC
jgi:hypothetical protein